MRSLAFDFRNDPAVYSIPDQYMFGPAFLVNPVTEQLYSSGNANKLEKTRQVYLPKATAWYDFWTGKKLTGGQSIAASCPIGIMPLYVRSGSIIPMGPVMEYATEKPADSIELRIYQGADGSFNYYEDANDTYNYEKGEYATFTFSWTDKRKELSISARMGTFPGMLKKRTFIIVLVKENKGSGVEETVKFDRVIQYDGKAVTVKNTLIAEMKTLFVIGIIFFNYRNYHFHNIFISINFKVGFDFPGYLFKLNNQIN